MKDFTPYFADSFVLTIANFVTNPTTISSIIIISYASSSSLTLVIGSLDQQSFELAWLTKSIY